MHTSSYEIRVNHLEEAEKFYRFILQIKGKRQKGKRYLFKLSELEIYLSERKEGIIGNIFPEIIIAVSHFGILLCALQGTGSPLGDSWNV